MEELKNEIKAWMAELDTSDEIDYERYCTLDGVLDLIGYYE